MRITSASIFVTRAMRASFIRLQILWLACQNLTTRKPIVSAQGPVVSLTTYGARLNRVHIAIESMARGRLLPSRIILWLCEPESASPIPKSLQRLERRGLEICKTEDFGPHKKYYPYVLAEEDFEHSLVTADDDVIYPRYWLKGLVEESKADPTSVICYRAHYVELDHDEIKPYSLWSHCMTTDPSPRNFPTGVCGVLYPPGVQKILADSRDAFLLSAPRADDIWLHYISASHGFYARQVFPQRREFLPIPGSSAGALFHENSVGGGNDAQLRATYTRSFIQLLASDGPTDHGR